MLVRFDSNVAGEMLMFADAARRLLQVAGKACTARGVIQAEQIPEIVVRLRAAVDADRAQHTKGNADDEEGAAEAPVTLSQRALPFIELLELTAREKGGFVLWEAAQDFDK